MDHIGFFLFESLGFDYPNDGIIKIKSKDKKTLKIHRCIARKSSIINNILLENDILLENIIDLPLEYSVIKEIRHYLYLNKINLCDFNYIKIYKGADFLDLEEIQIEVLEWSINENLNIDSVFKIEKMMLSAGVSNNIYMDIIKTYIDENLIMILKSPSAILNIAKSRVIHFFTHKEEIEEEIFVSAFIIWLKNSTENKHKIIAEFMNKEIIIPGLLSISFLWTDFYPFMLENGYTHEDAIMWNIMEIACFYPIHQLNNKYLYRRYEWALNLNIGSQFDYFNGNYKWINVIVIDIDKTVKKNKYECYNELLIKKENDTYNSTTKITIPNDLKEIDYLFSRHSIWKKTINKNDYVEIKINNIIYISKIIYRQDNDIIVYTDNELFFKIQLLSPKIKNYLELNSINIIIPYDILDFLNPLIIESMLEKMILEKQYSLNELVEVLI